MRGRTSFPQLLSPCRGFFASACVRPLFLSSAPFFCDYDLRHTGLPPECIVHQHVSTHTHTLRRSAATKGQWLWRKSSSRGYWCCCFWNGCGGLVAARPPMVDRRGGKGVTFGRAPDELTLLWGLILGTSINKKTYYVCNVVTINPGVANSS